MSNLWAAIIGSRGVLPYEINETTFHVDCLNQARFDRVASRYPFGLMPYEKGEMRPGGVVWASITTGKGMKIARSFYHPPTVLFSKGSKGVALWALREGSTVGAMWEANTKLARLVKGRLKDADPRDFRLDVRNRKAEWQMDGLYDLTTLVSHL